MARRSQCSSTGDNPLNPNYLPPHYREEYRLAIDALVEEDLEGYYQFLQKADVVDFLSISEIDYIQGSVQIPQRSNYPEQRFLETGGDGSSDTYWPIHSDLDAPGLDLGWPQLHHFMGPTEVTTLVNPPEPDMPSIKEQARRLIKNAQQVIAIVMDMFTDVDIFADILSAAMRNVAVYIILDNHNAHHFMNMVSHCRVNLQSIQFLRVRTVTGITYHCRSGKSFKGQMMDRFLLTDCRAVLSGNYSFMWSFEKLHRCMAHLFFGQLVTTFDEEFRILYAQSQPLMMENAVVPVDDRSLLHNRQYPGERTSLYREPRKFLSLDTPHPDDLGRQSYDERMDVDWRMMPLKRQETVHGPADMYGRFPSHQSRMDPSFDQGASRMPVMENPAFKRHSYAEGVHGRYSFPYLQQQGVPEPEPQGRPFHRGHQPYPGPGPGKEADYGVYDKFWNQDYHSTDQYPEPGLPQEMDLPDYDPVLNYITSTRNVDFDEGSEKLTSAADLPFSSSHPQRLSVGQLYPCQTSPSPSNPTDQKQFFQEPNTDRKDPMVKRGLRNWRISSYLSTYDNPDESLPLGPPNAPDPFEDPSNPVQPAAPAIDLPAHKIPNVREFKIPAIPRASQLPSYAKTTAREQPKKLPDEPTLLAPENKTPTPTPSESSSTTEGEKTEETEQKEPRTAIVQRDDSFRRKYSGAVQRSSRLRSSLIFSSLDQQHNSEDNKTAPGQQDEEGEKSEAEQTKLSFASQVLGQRRSTPREPFEWSRFIKSAAVDNSATDPSKPDAGATKEDDTDSSKDKNQDQESSKQPDVAQENSSPSELQSKPSETQLPKPSQPAKPPELLFASPLHLDMNDPDNRLRFFKELAAKRKAAKAAESEKSKEKGPIKPPTEQKMTNTSVKKKEPTPEKETPEKMSDISTSVALSEKNSAAEDAGKTASIDTCKLGISSLDTSDKTNMEESQVKIDPGAPQSSKEEETRVSTDLEKVEQRSRQSPATPPVPVEIETLQSKVLQEPQQSDPALETSSPTHPPTPTNDTPDNVPSLAWGADKGEITYFDSTSKESSSFTSRSVEESPCSPFSASVSDSNIQNPESFQSEKSISSPPHTGSEFSPSNPSVQSSSSDHFLSDFGSRISPSPLPSSSIPSETISPNTTAEESSSMLTSRTLSPNVQETINPSAPEPSATAEETSPNPMASSVNATESESSQVHLDPLTQLTCAPTLDVAESEYYQKDAGEKYEVLESSQDMRADSPPHSLSLSLPDSCLHNASDMESKPRSDQNETVSFTHSLEEAPPVYLLPETSSPVHPDVSAFQTETAASPQDEPTEVPPSDLNSIGSITPTETLSCCSPLTESVETVWSPEGEKTLSAVYSPTNAKPLPEQVPTDSEETEVFPSTGTCGPTESASDVPTELNLPCQTPESATPESQTEETPVPAKNSDMDCQNEDSNEPEIPEKKAGDTEATNKVDETTTDESVCSEKANDQVRQNSCSEMPEVPSDEVVPPSSQPKQPKSNQSRYHSSTANVLSSSNLRDDTKLLLEQISANSQTRNESTKESPVTDDEKEDEADKNAIRQKERGFRSFRREPPKSSQEREKLLERIQSMRKERKVYSRFEMAP